MTTIPLAGNLIAPEWSRAAGLDPWNYLAALADWQATVRERERLEQLDRHIMACWEANTRIVVELVSGRIGVGTAADLMLEINGRRTEFVWGVRRRHPNARSDRELFGHQAVSNALIWAGRNDVLRRRLEAELREEFGG